MTLARSGRGAGGQPNRQFGYDQRPGFGGVEHREGIRSKWRQAKPRQLRRQFALDVISGFDKPQRDVGAGREKILVVRHGCRDELVPIQHRAFGFQFAFAVFPGPFAAPVLLGVKNGNQRGENGHANQSPSRDSPPPTFIFWCFVHVFSS